MIMRQVPWHEGFGRKYVLLPSIEVTIILVDVVFMTLEEVQ